MDDIRLNENLEKAKTVCRSIYNLDENRFFNTLNKPTHSEMLFRPINDIPPNFHVTMPLSDVVMGLYPHNLSWHGIPQEFAEKHKVIQTQTNNKFTYEVNVLRNKIDFTNREIHKQYMENLLLHRIGATIVESFQAGNCGEFVGHATMNLLEIRHLLKSNFNLEVLQLSSTYHDKTHIIGTIDRKLESNIKDPSNWGNAAVTYDPWNKGKYFAAKEMMQIDYYKYGKWDKWETGHSFVRPSLDNLPNEFLELFNFYENYIITTKLRVGEAHEYIEEAQLPLKQ